MIKLTSRQREQLVYQLRRITDYRALLSERIDYISQFIARWEAKTIQKTGFPFGPRSSSLHIPYVAMIYDSIKARVMNALFGQDRDINVKAYTDLPVGLQDEFGQDITWKDIANDLEEYLLFEFGPSGEVRFRQFMERLFDEAAMTGTGIPIVTWQQEIERRLLPTARSFNEFQDVLVRDNLDMDVAAMEEYIFPDGYPDPYISKMPWFTHIYLLRPSQILQRIDSHGWDKRTVYEYLRSFGTAEAEKTEVQNASDDFESLAATFTYETGEKWIAETWIRYAPISEDGSIPKREVNIVVDHPLDHPEYIFRVIPWPYAHGRMKFARAFRYIARRNRFLGMGIPERLESIDEGISGVVNRILDAATAGNVPVWSVDSSVRGVRDFRDLIPGAVIKRGDDPNAIVPLSGPGVKPDIFEVLNVLNSFGEKVAKVSDYNLGRESQALGRQSTATATLALLQETGQYYDAVTRDLRASVADALDMARDLIAQFKPVERISLVLGKERARRLVAALQLPVNDLKKRLGIEVAFSSAAATRELARQEEMAKFEIMRTYYEGLLALAEERVLKPWKAPLIDDIANDGTRRLKALLETFGDSGRDLPNWSKYLEMFNQATQQTLEVQSGGGQLEGAVREPQVEGVPAGTPQAPEQP